MWVQSLGQEDTLEEEVGGKPTPIFLPEKIPWTGEPGKLRSRGSQRVGHNLATERSHREMSSE